MKKVTIKDIALKAGVANSTVTNALNPHSKKISAQKRAEILEIVNELGYIPSKSAQNLSTKSVVRIGFFIRSSIGFSRGIVDQKLIYYMNKFAHEMKVELITIITSYDQEESFKEIRNQINTYNLSHVVIQGLDNDLDILQKIINLETPKILIELPVTNPNTAFISTDNYRAQAELSELIIQKYQIKKPLYISGTLDAYVTTERISGFKSIIEKYQLEYQLIEASFEKNIANPIIQDLDFSNYDYIACGSDILASIVAKKCASDGLNNLIISGFDGDDFLSFFNQKIYTVYQDIELLCSNIIAMIAEDDISTSLLPYKIVDFN